MDGTSLNAKCAIESLSSFQSVLAHDLAYWDPFPLQVALMKHIFLIEIYSIQGWTATARHGVTRKRSRKTLKHTKNRFRKNPQLIGVCNSRHKAMLYHKTRATEPSDSFSHLRETSLDTRWEVEHFRLLFVFLVAGLVDLGWESLNSSSASSTEKEV